MIRLLALLLVPLAACDLLGDDTGPGADADTDVDTDTDTDTDTDSDWPGGQPDRSWEGDLSEGEIIDLGWAEYSTMACWPGTENVNFNGSHVFYEMDQDADRDLYIRLSPASGVDASLYAIQFGEGSGALPPDVSSCRACEASYDQTSDSNPGEVEEVFLLGYRPYDVVIGVAGADGATSGAFTVEVWDEPGSGFDTDR